MTLKKFLVTAAIVLPAASQAGVFHNITSVTSTTSATDLFIVDNLIEGSGVGFDVNPPHDRTSGSTWVTNAPNGGVADYFDPLPDPAPVFVFDLGADVELQEISVWGYSDTNGNGAKQFSLRFATEAEGTTGFGTSITYNPTFAATLPATPRQSSLFPDMVTARYVELTPEDNFFEDLTGGDRVGLGEVAFEILSVAAEPNIEVQDSFNFPTSSFIQAANIQVRNLGAQDLTVSGTNWTGPNAEAFSTLALPATLAELESGNVEIQLDPAGQTPGSISATLQIMSNDPDTPTAKIAVTSTIPAAGASFYPIASVESDTAGGDLWPAENLIQGPGEGFNADPPHDQLGGGDTHRWVTNAPGGYPSDYIEAGGTPIITLDLGEDRPCRKSACGDIPPPTRMASASLACALRRTRTVPTALVLPLRTTRHLAARRRMGWRSMTSRDRVFPSKKRPSPATSSSLAWTIGSRPRATEPAVSSLAVTAWGLVRSPSPLSIRSPQRPLPLPISSSMAPR